MKARHQSCRLMPRRPVPVMNRAHFTVDFPLPNLCIELISQEESIALASLQTASNGSILSAIPWRTIHDLGVSLQIRVRGPSHR